MIQGRVSAQVLQQEAEADDELPLQARVRLSCRVFTYLSLSLSLSRQNEKRKVTVYAEIASDYGEFEGLLLQMNNRLRILG